MAGRFSLSIPFNGKQHKALVRMRQQGCDLVCFVHFGDKEMQDIFSGNSLVFSLFEGLKQPRNLCNSRAVNLVRSTTTAISKYLQAA